MSIASYVLSRRVSGPSLFLILTAALLLCGAPSGLTARAAHAGQAGQKALAPGAPAPGAATPAQKNAATDQAGSHAAPAALTAAPAATAQPPSGRRTPAVPNARRATRHDAAGKNAVPSGGSTGQQSDSPAQGAARAGAEPDAAAKAPAAPLPGGPAGEAVRAYARGDFLKARDIWQKLAEAGDGQAMNNLGVLYDQAQGVEPDAGRALHWFALSAKAGHPSGMSNYGRMLEQGRGIAADPQEAARWFDLAARKGQPEAQYNLGLLYEQGRGVAQSDQAAAAWYSRAAAQQQTEALARLGHLYRTGRGVTRNAGRATLLLYAAAMNGQAQAMKELEEMAREEPARPRAVLFGRELDNVDRATLRATLKTAGLPASREDDAFICDLYDARRLIPGASQMAACYGPGAPAPLGFVKIDYPASDKATAERILRMVEERFGPPSAGEGDDARLWNLGSVVVATQYAPTHRRMSLMYMIPRVYHLTRRK